MRGSGARTLTAGILVIGVTLVGCTESSTGPEREAPSPLSSRGTTTPTDVGTDVSRNAEGEQPGGGTSDSSLEIEYPDAATEAATESVTGVVVDVVGDLTATTSFRLLTEDGSRLDFVPDPGATFHGGPMSHIRDHLLSGEPVRVEYVIGADPFVALYVEDAGHEH